MTELAPPAPFPRLTLPRIGGGEIAFPIGDSLSLVVVFKESCATCRWALPFVQALHERVDGVAVVGVAEDDEGTTRRLADELGLRFPIAWEVDPWPLSAALGLTTVPTSFLVDGDGKVLLTSPGFSRDDFVEVARRAAAPALEPVDPFPEGEDIPAFRPG